MSKVRCAIGSKSEEPCGQAAPYYADRWGHGVGADDLHLCADHAGECFDDGWEVTGPHGYPVKRDEDGELYEVQP